MEGHEEFDKELEKAPKNADLFMIVMPYNRKKCWYDASNVKYEFTEGRIDKEDIHTFLTKLQNEVPRTLQRINYEKLDGAAVLILMMSLIGLGLGIYFSLGKPFEGYLMAIVLVSAIGLLGSIVYIAVACVFRNKLHRKRVSKLEQIIAQSQADIFSKKGALVSLSPLESYITIEMIWKYIRFAMNTSPEDAEMVKRIPTLKVFNQNTVNTILEKESKDKTLLNAIHDIVVLNPNKFFSLDKLSIPSEGYSSEATNKNYTQSPTTPCQLGDTDEIVPLEAKASKVSRGEIELKKEGHRIKKIELFSYEQAQYNTENAVLETQNNFAESNVLVTMHQSPDLETKMTLVPANKLNYDVIEGIPGK